MVRSALMILVVLVAQVTLALAPAAGAPEGTPGKWVSISDGVLDKLVQDGKKPGWPGKTAGVAVDRVNGDLFMVVCDQGLWKSTDHGKTFARTDDGKIGGRCETGFALNMDPAGSRMMGFMVYGGSGISTDRGATWIASKLTHVDFGAVDWDASAKCVLTVMHERNGKLMLSTDGARTWKDLGDGFKALGLFDEKNLLASKGNGILRSTDGGATWNQVSDLKPAGLVMQVFNGVGYWTSAQGVLASRDHGATWSVLGAPVNGYYGPYFGKDDRSLMVVGKDGCWKTDDRGLSWRLAAPLPHEFTVGFTGPNFAWDPASNILYASSMGKDTYEFKSEASRTR